MKIFDLYYINVKFQEVITLHKPVEILTGLINSLNQFNTKPRDPTTFNNLNSFFIKYDSYLEEVEKINIDKDLKDILLNGLFLSKVQARKRIKECYIDASKFTKTILHVTQLKAAYVPMNNLLNSINHLLSTENKEVQDYISSGLNNTILEVNFKKGKIVFIEDLIKVGKVWKDIFRLLYLLNGESPSEVPVFYLENGSIIEYFKLSPETLAIYLLFANPLIDHAKNIAEAYQEIKKIEVINIKIENNKKTGLLKDLEIQLMKKRIESHELIHEKKMEVLELEKEVIFESFLTTSPNIKEIDKGGLEKNIERTGNNFINFLNSGGRTEIKSIEKEIPTYLKEKNISIKIIDKINLPDTYNEISAAYSDVPLQIEYASNDLEDTTKE